jgi:hypothetical protein
MTDDRWTDAYRLEAWAGEVRVNLIRAAALLAFYGHHLLNVYVIGDDPTLKGHYHTAVTAVALAWGVGVFVLHVCLTRRWVPPALKYVATAWDLVLITSLLIASPSGPRSALVLLYFVVIASSPLRLSKPLVWMATLGAMGAAAVALGHYVFLRIGVDAYYAETLGEASRRIDRASEVLFLLALGTCGLLAGQVVRQARRLVQGYPVRVETREAA